jgi:hypothetical protein
VQFVLADPSLIVPPNGSEVQLFAVSGWSESEHIIMPNGRGMRVSHKD